MYEYETEYQSAEISGAPLTICDVCGIPVDQSTYLTSGRGSSPAVADRLLRVCEACFAEIEGGEMEIFNDGAAAAEFDAMP